MICIRTGARGVLFIHEVSPGRGAEVGALLPPLDRDQSETSQKRLMGVAVQSMSQDQARKFGTLDCVHDTDDRRLFNS